jgi:serine/threonine protein kinase
MSERTLPPRYSSITHLASGGMGEVYRATDGLLGRTVAVKVLADRHARDPDVRARFTREARAAARLSAHPHVVTVFDVGEHDGHPFIVMEYLQGGSVYDRARSSTVRAGLALEWLRQAASAIDAAHAQGVVHRDVKPANLLLDGEERVHVTDFGIASAAGFDTLTLPGTVLGTAGYLSPEQARGETATPASDRYALGIVAYELLTGRRPYEAETPMTEAFAHINAPIPSAERATTTLPSGIDAVFQRALAKEPSERPTSAGELVGELRDAFRDAEPVTAVLPATVAAAPSVRRAWRRPLVAVALVGLLLSGLVAAAFVSNGDEPRVRTITRVRTAVSTVSDTASTFTVTQTTTVPDVSTSTTAPNAPTTTTPPSASGASLNDAGFRRMQARDYAGALPLLEQAVAALAGTGSLAEAYASYNLAFTRLGLGRCDGVLELLDRSEAVQGYRAEIRRLRKDAEKRCGDEKAKGDEGANE